MKLTATCNICGDALLLSALTGWTWAHPNQNTVPDHLGVPVHVQADCGHEEPCDSWTDYKARRDEWARIVEHNRRMLELS